ncbi:MAG: hypothetical protein DWQ10_09420 [Calditrichaeota bacterium]|nr:MAG: hypothetical protein DWQ10_09420 [Calditrichota bacterium]
MLRFLKIRLLHGFKVALILIVILASSTFAKRPALKNRATIKPSLVRLQPSEKTQFKIVMLATRLMAAQLAESVQWSVNDIPGGNKVIGTIDKNGTYQAPQRMPSPREIHICAYVEEAANKRLFASVILGDGEPEYTSQSVWSEKSSDKEMRMKGPHGIGLDKHGNILIADQTAWRIFRFSVEGKFLGEIGEGPGTGPGQFKEPREVHIDAQGNICVTDSKGDRPRIQFFSDDGKFQRIFAEKGRGPGQLLRSHGIGFDHNQNLFVTDVDNMRMNVYSYSGEFLYDFGGGFAYEGMNPNEINAPHGVYVDPSGDVFINSYYGPTQKYTAGGEVLLAFAHGDPPYGPVYFHNITGDNWGNVYIMVRGKGGYQGEFQRDQSKKISIMKYNNNGDYITGWSFTDPEHGESDAVVDDEGRVYALFTSAKEKGVEIFVQE